MYISFDDESILLSEDVIWIILSQILNCSDPACKNPTPGKDSLTKETQNEFLSSV
jgi:hypothetical protein